METEGRTGAAARARRFSIGGPRDASLLVKLLSLAALTVLFAAILGNILYDALADAEASIAAAKSANDTVLASDRVVVTLVEMETTILSYIAQADPARIDAFKARRAQFVSDLDALIALRDDPADVARLRAVGQRVDEWEKAAVADALTGAQRDPASLALLNDATTVLQDIRQQAELFQQEHRADLASTVAQSRAAARLVREILIGGGIAFAVVLLIATYALVRSVVGRVVPLARAARAFGLGQLDVPLPPSPEGGDELDTLGRSFTQMRDRLRELIGEKERHLAEARATGAELEEVNARQRRFISIVSHEFRTPLTGIQGFSELIRDEDLTPEETREYADDINRDAQRLARLIGEMLDLGRLESGRIELTLSAVDLNAVVREVVARSAPAAGRRELRVETDDSLPPIRADADKITQVMTNLVSNAVKYSADGGTVTVATQREDDGVHVSVADTGFGIPAGDLERIFEPYERVESSETARVEGTGLGLPIVRGIVRLHGGRVWVESQIGRGSTFHVVLPPQPPA